AADRQLAFQADENGRRTAAVMYERPAAPVAVEPEVLALYQPFALDRAGVVQRRPGRPPWPGREVRTRERLLDVQLPRATAFRVDAAPVVQTVGDGARLLDLENH